MKLEGDKQKSDAEQQGGGQFNGKNGKKIVNLFETDQFVRIVYIIINSFFRVTTLKRMRSLILRQRNRRNVTECWRS